MTKVMTKTIKKQEAYQYIKGNILSGAFGPGYRIIIDRVAKELNLSIIPVREAIQQLEADGLIEIVPYSGAIVRQVNETDYLEAAFVMLVLEAAATALASQRLTAKDIQALEEINTKMKESLNSLDLEQVGVMNVAFHSAIHEKCGNSYLIDKLKQVWQRVSQVRHASIAFAPQRAKESTEEHDRLIKLFKEKAPAAVIEECVRQHNQNTIDAVHNLSLKAGGQLFHSM